MDRLNDYVKDKLDEIHESKKGKILPDHVTLIELNNAILKDVRETLNGLFKEGDIKAGDTINGKYITRNNWN